jgi:hypothetical protein
MDHRLTDGAVQGALLRRLDEVDEELADLRSLLVIMRRIERDEMLRQKLRGAELGFRLQDLWAGRITGDGLRRALVALEQLAAAPLRA